MLGLAFLVLSAGLLGQQARAACECGYSVNKTSDTEHAVFTELLESDFLHLQTIKEDTDWTVENYADVPTHSNDNHGKNRSIANVETNPIADRYGYSGPGVRGGDPGLNLYVRPPAPGLNSLVPVAEIVSTRNDMMYGSFRIAMKYGSVPGTCGSMFFYFNDTNEIDYEFLSTLQVPTATTAPVFLVLHSPAGSNFQVHQLPFLPQQGFHEYRFDWMPNKVSYYADGIWLHDLTTGMPTMPGTIHLFHWSTGDPNWSRGPPKEDAKQTVSYVKAYFNSSSPERHEAYQKRCSQPSDPQAVCEILPNRGIPDPAGKYGETFFFTAQNNQTEGQINYELPWYNTPKLS